MPTATMTTKGQLTIPKRVRVALGLAAGDAVMFRLRTDGVAEMHRKTIDLSSLAGMVEAKDASVEVREMNEAVLSQAVDSFEKATRRSGRRRTGRS
jgi:AbrB family looped-hinge helix DNA binding protein